MERDRGVPTHVVREVVCFRVIAMSNVTFHSKILSFYEGLLGLTVLVLDQRRVRRILRPGYRLETWIGRNT